MFSRDKQIVNWSLCTSRGIAGECGFRQETKISFKEKSLMLEQNEQRKTRQEFSFLLIFANVCCALPKKARYSDVQLSVPTESKSKDWVGSISWSNPETWILDPRLRIQQQGTVDTGPRLEWHPGSGWCWLSLPPIGHWLLLPTSIEPLNWLQGGESFKGAENALKWISRRPPPTWRVYGWWWHVLPFCAFVSLTDEMLIQEFFSVRNAFALLIVFFFQRSSAFCTQDCLACLSWKISGRRHSSFSELLCFLNGSRFGEWDLDANWIVWNISFCVEAEHPPKSALKRTVWRSHIQSKTQKAFGFVQMYDLKSPVLHWMQQQIRKSHWGRLFMKIHFACNLDSRDRLWWRTVERDLRSRLTALKECHSLGNGEMISQMVCQACPQIGFYFLLTDAALRWHRYSLLCLDWKWMTSIANMTVRSSDSFRNLGLIGGTPPVNVPSGIGEKCFVCCAQWIVWYPNIYQAWWVLSRSIRETLPMLYPMDGTAMRDKKNVNMKAMEMWCEDGHALDWRTFVLSSDTLKSPKKP